MTAGTARLDTAARPCGLSCEHPGLASGDANRQNQRVSNEWRRVVAALANPERRAVYAGIVLDSPVDVPPARQAKARAALADAGLLTLHADGSATLVERVFADLLALDPEVKREGVQKFVRDGRIESYPMKPAERLDLLRWVVGELDAGPWSEAAINDALASFHPDVAALRRYLVDAELLERAPDGSRYYRV